MIKNSKIEYTKYILKKGNRERSRKDKKLNWDEVDEIKRFKYLWLVLQRNSGFTDEIQDKWKYIILEKFQVYSITKEFQLD